MRSLHARESIEVFECDDDMIAIVADGHGPDPRRIEIHVDDARWLTKAIRGVEFDIKNPVPDGI